MRRLPGQDLPEEHPDEGKRWEGEAVAGGGGAPPDQVPLVPGAAGEPHHLHHPPCRGPEPLRHELPRTPGSRRNGPTHMQLGAGANACACNTIEPGRTDAAVLPGRMNFFSTEFQSLLSLVGTTSTILFLLELLGQDHRKFLRNLIGSFMHSG
jgi:hypothetical protein